MKNLREVLRTGAEILGGKGRTVELPPQNMESSGTLGRLGRAFGTRLAAALSGATLVGAMGCANEDSSSVQSSPDTSDIKCLPGEVPIDNLAELAIKERILDSTCLTCHDPKQAPVDASFRTFNIKDVACNAALRESMAEQMAWENMPPTGESSAADLDAIYQLLTGRLLVVGESFDTTNELYGYKTPWDRLLGLDRAEITSSPIDLSPLGEEYTCNVVRHPCLEDGLMSENCGIISVNPKPDECAGHHGRLRVIEAGQLTNLGISTSPGTSFTCPPDQDHTLFVFAQGTPQTTMAEGHAINIPTDLDESGNPRYVLVFEAHQFNECPGSITAQSALDLYITQESFKPLSISAVGTLELEIPPGNTSVERTLTISETTTMEAMMLHGHSLLKKFEVYVQREGESKQERVALMTGDLFHNQIFLKVNNPGSEDPLKLNPGDKLVLVGGFRNPTDETVRWGLSSENEMFEIFAITHGGEIQKFKVTEDPLPAVELEIAECLGIGSHGEIFKTQGPVGTLPSASYGLENDRPLEEVILELPAQVQITGVESIETWFECTDGGMEPGCQAEALNFTLDPLRSYSKTATFAQLQDGDFYFDIITRESLATTEVSENFPGPPNSFAFSIVDGALTADCERGEGEIDVDIMGGAYDPERSTLRLKIAFRTRLLGSIRKDVTLSLTQ